MKAKRVKNRFKILAIVLFAIFYGCKNNAYKESLAAETVDISEDFEIAEMNVTSKLSANQSNVPRDLKIKTLNQLINP